MPVSRDDAANWWRTFHAQEFAPRLTAMRPKPLYPAYMITTAKTRVQAAIPTVDSVDELTAIALTVFDGAVFSRKSPYYKKV